MFSWLKKKSKVDITQPLHFVAQNFDDLAYDLDVVGQAEKAGKANLPPMTASRQDANELSFRGKFSTDARIAKNMVAKQAGVLTNEISQISFAHELADLDLIKQQFTKRVEVEYKETSNNLTQIKRSLDDAESELSQFKKKNRLRTAADYPDTKVYSIGILLAIFVVESVLNGYFFANGSDFGLVGGVMEALAVSLINVGFGFILGWFILPFKNHISPKVRTRAWVVTGAFVLFFFAFNLLVAHIREAMEVSPDAAARAGWGNFKDNPFGISDGKSWFMFLIGQIFVFIAVFDGYTFDDSYPGYGSLARRVTRYRDELDDERAGLIGRFAAIVDEYEERLDENHRLIRSKKKRRDMLLATLQHSQSVYESYVETLRQGYQFVVTLYRQTNVENRTADAPPYFQEEITLDLDVYELEARDVSEESEIENRIKLVSGSIPDVRQSILDVKERYLQQLDEAVIL